MERTNEDYLKAMHNLFDKEYKSIVSKQENCQYKGKDKYCLATTHKTCRGCKLFTPTTQSKLRIVIEKTEELQKKIKSRDMTIAKLQAEINRLKEIIDKKDGRILDLLSVLEER